MPTTQLLTTNARNSHEFRALELVAGEGYAGVAAPRARQALRLPLAA
jgi:hypothetical protein